MAKRSISNDEIALIKAMLARGMKNKDIQFLFQPDEPDEIEAEAVEVEV